MVRSTPLGNFSRTEMQLDEHVLCLEIDGQEGWWLPSFIAVKTGEVVLRWELIADQPMILRRYRIVFGERSFEFLAETTVSKGDDYQITATLTRV